MKRNIACLILAAGSSSRMGSQKQLLEWRGSTLLGSVVTMAISVFPEDVFVVVGSGKDVVEEELSKFNLQTVFNPEWTEGIGKSIAHGVSKLDGYDGVLILVADQPFLNSKHLLKMIEYFDNNVHGIIASGYRNIKKPVVPILFDKIYFDELIQLSGENGAQQLLKNHESSVIQLHTVTEFVDIDTPKDYEKCCRMISKK